MRADAFAGHLAFAALLALLSAGVVRLVASGRFLLDHPGRRAATAHRVATPKGGGLGVVAAFVAGMVVLYLHAGTARIADPQFLGVIGAALAIAAVGLADDAWELRTLPRLAAQLGAALVAAGSGLVLTRLALPWFGVVDLGAWGVALTLFWVVGCTNAVNFMDGMDGLVGGSLLVACAALCAVAAVEGGWFVYAAALFLAAGLAGFVPSNVPVARVFLGDVGSQFLGFAMAVLAVAASRFDANQVSFLVVPLLLFGLLFDAGLTLARRAAMGEPLARPHRTHLYQMAQRAGVPAARVAALHWGFAAFHGALALAFTALSPAAKPLVVLPALAAQLAWAGYVAARVRRAGLSWRGA